MLVSFECWVSEGPIRNKRPGIYLRKYSTTVLLDKWDGCTTFSLILVIQCNWYNAIIHMALYM